MTSPARIVISTFGSFGDIHPYMSVALELQRRGHDPVIGTMEYYREKIEAVGLEFAPVRPHIPAPGDQDSQLIEKIMEPKTGPRFLTEEVVFPAVRDSYEDLLKLAEGAALLVTHPAAPAGPLVGRKLGLPWVSTVLAPLSFLSAYDPPVPPYCSWLVNLRVFGPRVMGTFLTAMKNTYKAQLLTDFREELQLANYGNPMFEGQHSPSRVLALFSSVFAQEQPDWPPQTRTTGFCFYNEQQAALSAELQHFLESGEPPIIFTLGSSAVWVAKDFFEESIKATLSLKRRALLVIGDARNRPESVPDEIFLLNYAPYQSLLPRGAAVVHHGGVGTTSQGLRAGVPTLIVPFAFDQMDNADHARRLGTSRILPRKNYRAANIARELSQLLTVESYAVNARCVGQRLRQEDGPGCAADYIEEQLAQSNFGREELLNVAGN